MNAFKKENTTELQGKAALVTDADTGICQATVELLTQEGTDICVSDHTDQSGADKTKRRRTLLG